MVLVIWQDKEVLSHPLGPLSWGTPKAGLTSRDINRTFCYHRQEQTQKERIEVATQEYEILHQVTRFSNGECFP